MASQHDGVMRPDYTTPGATWLAKQSWFRESKRGHLVIPPATTGVFELKEYVPEAPCNGLELWTTKPVSDAHAAWYANSGSFMKAQVAAQK
eukprot:335568-Amphidinium_carterae.1